jgi:hypothetical protein
LRDAAESQWTAERLRISVQSKLGDTRLFAISNREPYEHFRKGNAIEYSVPASGLVTALEPILRACDGTWIAQGTGAADRETVDANDRLRVPPDHPQYTLRRVWVTPKKKKDSTSDSRMKDCGPCATSRTRVRCFVGRIGSNTIASTGASPTHFWRKRPTRPNPDGAGAGLSLSRWSRA